MQTYRVCPLLTRPYHQKDTVPFIMNAKNMDNLRKALIARDTDGTVFDVEHPSSGRIFGKLIIRPGIYIWENSNTAYPVDPKTGKLGKRRY